MIQNPTPGIDPARPMLSTDLLRRLAPSGRDLDQIARAMNDRFPVYDITTGRRIACFLGQTGHESGGFRVWVENLNYSADALRRVWPSRFPGHTADVYARQPERIACRAYANRMGNGDEASGDGWRFRGRGLIQITGRSNYTRLAEDTGWALADLPALLERPEGAVESALWFWKANNLNRFADRWDIDGLTKAINGGTHGLADRRKRTADAADLLNISL